MTILDGVFSLPIIQVEPGFRPGAAEDSALDRLVFGNFWRHLGQGAWREVDLAGESVSDRLFVACSPQVLSMRIGDVVDISRSAPWALQPRLIERIDALIRTLARLGGRGVDADFGCQRLGS